jgi:hypothetical protein
MLMNQQAAPQGGQMVQQLRQMDHEQLVMLTMQLIARLQQIEGAAGPQPMR